MLVATGGYAVVGLFGIALAAIDGVWPQLSSTGRVTAATLVAAPLAIALLWPRLAGVKAFGFELSLTQASVKPNVELASVLMRQQYFSDPEALVDGVTGAIRSGAQVVEVDLRDGEYWWCSRLYLLAALASDYTSVRALVFVEGGARRSFVGIAAPGLVRSALGAELPELDRIYANLKPDQPELTPAQRVAKIGIAWTSQFGGPEQPPAESKLPRVSADRLVSWLATLGTVLDSPSVEWKGISDPRVVITVLALELESTYVALVRGRRLDIVVNRIELGKRIAQREIA